MVPDTLVKSYRESVMKLGRFVETLFDRSVYALMNRDPEMAKRVIEDDKIADQMRDELVEESVCLIGEYAPVGKHLVEISKGIILSNTLEMIGDRAKSIALNTRTLIKEPALKPLVDLPKMASTAEEMIRNSLSVYIDGSDSSKIDKLLEMEEYVDALNRAVEDELKLYMMQSSKNIARAMRLIFISRDIEEVADLCLKVLTTYDRTRRCDL